MPGRVLEAIRQSDQPARNVMTSTVVSTNLFEFAGVSKWYDDKCAVRSMDLVVPRGSVFGLIGPNGAGKTTSLKMMATLIKPDEGTIRLLGEDIGVRTRSARRRIGYMPDRFGTFRAVSCDEYLEFFGRACDLFGSVLRRRVDDVIALTDLVEVREESTVALSTGMRQRLCLAKTLLHDPDVLILDEPASGLDPRARIEIRSLLKELARMGKTIVISSHILADLEEICSDIAIIEEGSVVWSGSLEGARAADALEKTVVHLEVSPGDVARAVELCGGIGGVQQARVIDRERGRIEAHLRDVAGNALLAALIEAGVEIRAYSRERLNLETIFLERTRGVVS